MRLRHIVWLTMAALIAVTGGGAGVCATTSLDCRSSALLRAIGLEGATFDPPPTIVAGPASFEDGFVEETVVRGLIEPTDFAFLPDGRILVAEKRGIVRLVENGRISKRPVLDLRGTVSSSNFRGLVTIQVDEGFPRQPYIYVLRTLAVPERLSPTNARLSRFVLDGSVARRESEVVLLGGVAGGQSCLELPPTDDCLPADAQHIGGQIHFESSGTLLVSTGDGGGGAGFDAISGRAQDVDSLGGKILRITRTGEGLRTNPYWNGDPTANRSKVWALGLRNPFRWTFRPGAEDLVVADLGEDRNDELSVVDRGANLGWPCYEGHARYGPYKGFELCSALYREGVDAVRAPVVVFGPQQARSLIGGVFYTGAAYPTRYAGAYFFADFIYGWMKILRFDDRGRPVGAPQRLGLGLSGPVAIHQEADGLLYYLSYVRGELRRIRHRG